MHVSSSSYDMHVSSSSYDMVLQAATTYTQEMTHNKKDTCIHDLWCDTVLVDATVTLHAQL